MSRTPFVGGNWKMNTGRESGPALAREVSAGAAKRLLPSGNGYRIVSSPYDRRWR